MEGSPGNALEVHGLTIKYGELPALKSVDLSVGHGRIVGIVGESGSGKSTLASALIGLLPNSAKITKGNILFDGSVWDKKIKKNKIKTFKYIRSVVPMKKFGTIDDIFDLCIFIENNKSQFASGSTFVLDGAQTKNF